MINIQIQDTNLPPGFIIGFIGGGGPRASGGLKYNIAT